MKDKLTVSPTIEAKCVAYDACDEQIDLRNGMRFTQLTALSLREYPTCKPNIAYELDGTEAMSSMHSSRTTGAAGPTK